jgi:hypothetical protein
MQIRRVQSDRCFAIHDSLTESIASKSQVAVVLLATTLIATERSLAGIVDVVFEIILKQSVMKIADAHRRIA